MKLDSDAIDGRLDQLVSVDFGSRGLQPLYEAARERSGGPLVGAAADRLAALEAGVTVVIATGSVSRGWISPTVGENDGPAGAAVIVRGLVLGKRARCIVLAEETLLPALAAILTAAGLTVLPLEEAIRATEDGSLAAVALRPFTTDDDEAPQAASELLNELNPSLLFSAERAGRNSANVYHNMGGLDYGAGRARVDYLFDAALEYGIPTVAVGDGGNEIGMGGIAQVVRDHIPYGRECRCPCRQGIAAVTGADALVVAACSNWGCYAIAAALAVRLRDSRLVHTRDGERALLRRSVDAGLINAVDGIVDQRVDGIEVETHLALVDLIDAAVRYRGELIEPDHPDARGAKSESANG